MEVYRPMEQPELVSDELESQFESMFAEIVPPWGGACIVALPADGGVGVVRTTGAVDCTVTPVWGKFNGEEAIGIIHRSNLDSVQQLLVEGGYEIDLLDLDSLTVPGSHSARSSLDEASQECKTLFGLPSTGVTPIIHEVVKPAVYRDRTDVAIRAVCGGVPEILITRRI